jgi:catechol 2,3-dioxygenase-like lactoylglutathione lyase family enzyme
MGIDVNSLHHVTIRVSDQDVSRRFYEEVLGFAFLEIPVSGDVIAEWKGSPTQGMMLAMQAGPTFIILAPTLEGTADDDRFSERRIGVDHLAFGVDGRAQLEELAGSLDVAGVDTAGIEVDPVLGKEYVCFRDPDNVQWEFYVTA